MKTNLHPSLRALGKAYHDGKLSTEAYRRQRRIELEELGSNVVTPVSSPALTHESGVGRKTNRKRVMIAVLLVAIIAVVMLGVGMLGK